MSKLVYGEAPPDLLAIAAERGTEIHRATQELDEKGECSIQEDFAPYIAAYNKFLADKKPVWEGIEMMVHKDDVYAGTLDRYGLIDGQHAIVDIKTAAKINKQSLALYTAAQNLYRMAIQPFVSVDRLLILQIMRDETYKLIELPIDDTLANACLAIHQALKKERRKRKDD